MENMEVAFLTVDNLSAVCRICLQCEENMIDIFGCGMDNQIMEVTKLKVKSDDKLPQTICHSCKLQMDNLFKFIEQAKSSDIYLRSLLVKHKKFNEPVENKNNSEKKCYRKQSVKKKFKGQYGHTKSFKKLKSEVESEKMYLIVVPKSDEKSGDSEISIKDLTYDNTNEELTYYCRNLVKSHFYDHTYPKEQRYSSSCEAFDYVTKNVAFSTVESEHQDNKVFLVNLNVFKCDDCEKTFENISDLNSHFVVHETTPTFLLGAYECPVCDYKENNKDNFMVHLQNHETEGYAFVKMNSEGKEISLRETISESRSETNFKATDNRIFYMNLNGLKCTVCLQNIESEELIAEHFKSCTLKEISKIEHLVKYACPVCNKLFFNEKDNFIQHLASHQENNFYFISVDDTGQVVEEKETKIFLPYEEAIEILEMLKSDKIIKILEVNSCEHCDYISDSFDMLCKHYSSIHFQEMSKHISLACPVCSEEWKIGDVDENRVNLYNHLKLHKNEGFAFIRVNKKGLLIDITQPDLEMFNNSELLWSFFNNPPTVDQIWSPELVLTEQENSQTDQENSHEYVCDLCQKQFLKKQEVIRHLKSHQAKDFDSQSLNYICEKCGKKCTGKISYKKHFSKHLKSLSRVRPTCTVCHKTFSNRSTLNGHMKQHLKEGINNDSGKNLLEIICEKCGKGFSNNASLTKHKKQHGRDKENSIFKCEICGRDFFRQSSFDRHKSAHLNPRYFDCDTCKLPLPSEASLQKHSELHLNGSNTFDCKTCRVSFLTKDSLAAHQTRTGHYLDRKPLECNVCHEKFFIGRRFTEHIKTHPKYKMGECSLCGKRLSTIQSLMLHMDRHFESNCILCPHCGKQFFEERNYRRHLLTHEGIRPFACDVENCKKSFYTLFELNRHKKYHNNTRDFRCIYCSKSFHEANHLTVHVRIHTGERPYICPHCNKGFATRTRCKQHIKLVHQGIGYDLIRSSISKKVTVYCTKEAAV